MCKRLEIVQLQMLHHVESALFVLQEVGSLDVVPISLLRGVNFEDANLCGVLFQLCWEEAYDSQLLGETCLLNLSCGNEVFRKKLRIHLDFCQAIEHCRGSRLDIHYALRKCGYCKQHCQQ